MEDLDYSPNPTFSLDSCPTNNNDIRGTASDNKGEEEGHCQGESRVEKPNTLSVKIPKSRDSESPKVQTPIVS